MGQRTSTQDQIQGDQCEPEELEEPEDEKLGRTANELGSRQIKTILYQIFYTKLSKIL